MATAKKRQNGELGEKIHDDLSRQQESVMTSQSVSFSTNQMQKKQFSEKRELTKKCDNFMTSETSSNNSSKSFHDNQHIEFSMATSDSQSNAFNPTTSLFSDAYRQKEIQNNLLI